MKHLISFSGGMGSFAEAHACVMKYGKENVKLLFADTNMEDEDLYRFMDECVKFLDVELEVIADGTLLYVCNDFYSTLCWLQGYEQRILEVNNT